jgi:hypothetical protein
MKPNETQLQQVKDHLTTERTITSWDAIALYRITRLSQYISILRGEGMDIKMTRVHPKTSNWYGLYILNN